MILMLVPQGPCKNTDSKIVINMNCSDTVQHEHHQMFLRFTIKVKYMAHKRRNIFPVLFHHPHLSQTSRVTTQRYI